MTTRTTAWVCVLLAGVLGACGTSNDDVTDGHGDARDDGGGECTAGEGRCVGSAWETCTGGHWGAGTNCNCVPGASTA